jgi:serine/threonine protein kinase
VTTLDRLKLNPYQGGFSYVYLVKDLTDPNKSDNSTSQSHQGDPNAVNGSGKDRNPVMVLKVTSIHSRAQRDIAEKEAKLLSRLSHPSIIKMYDWCYRTTPQNVGVVGSIIGGAGGNKDAAAAAAKDGRPQHIILMEYCEGGHALDVCNKLANAGQRFDLAALIIAFGQICNAVSYLHAQRPPIVHRDLKPVNFLVKNGAYKLCDFGSAVFGHVELNGKLARQEADEVIQKTTTQMFRAPEMVDLFMSKKLTQR